MWMWPEIKVRIGRSFMYPPIYCNHLHRDLCIQEGAISSWPCGLFRLGFEARPSDDSVKLIDALKDIFWLPPVIQDVPPGAVYMGDKEWMLLSFGNGYRFRRQVIEKLSERGSAAYHGREKSCVERLAEEMDWDDWQD